MLSTLARLLVPFSFFLLTISPVSAKKFASQYCEFELPPGWNCALEGTEWVCQSSNKARKKEAIIILAAKIRGQQDSLDQYQAYLKSTKTFKLPGGKTQVSEPKYNELKTINQHRWVDALHLASEVPGFYTRYLATVKEDLGVAVTLSVSKDLYGSYQGVFDKIVSTLRVFRQRAVAMGDINLKKQDENLLDDTSFIPGSDEKYGIQRKKKQGGGIGNIVKNPIVWVVLALGGVGFALMKGKKKKIKKKGPPPSDDSGSEGGE